MFRRKLTVALLSALSLALPACGGGGEGRGAESPRPADLDSDPIALLPADAFLVAKVDAHALLGYGGVGAKLGDLLQRKIPGATEADVIAARDVDGVLVGEYDGSTAAFLAVVSGRFDEARVEKMMSAGATSDHPPLKESYAGHTLYGAGRFSAARLSGKTLLFGSDPVVRRALDRIAAGKLAHEVPPKTLETLTAKGGAVAFVADIARLHGGAGVNAEEVPLPWLHDLQSLRAVAELGASAVQVKGAFSYLNGDEARGAAEGLRALPAIIRVLGHAVPGGLSIQDLIAGSSNSDATVSFGMNVPTLEHAITAAARELGGAP